MKRLLLVSMVVLIVSGCVSEKKPLPCTLSTPMPAAGVSAGFVHLDTVVGGAVVKRLGFLLETLALPVPDLKARLERWQGMLSQGIAHLEPGAGRTGRIATRWRVRVNIAVDQIGGQRVTG